MVPFMSSASSFQNDSFSSCRDLSNSCSRHCQMLFVRVFVLMVIMTTTMTTTTKTTFVSSLELTTTTKTKLSSHDLQRFLSTPSNWPKIVASSNQVSTPNGDPTIPMNKGDTVEEFFGLNLLSVQWTCIEKSKTKRKSKSSSSSSFLSLLGNKKSSATDSSRRSVDDDDDNDKMSLLFSAPDGVPGIANDCSMKFDIKDISDNSNNNINSSSEVKLTMGFNPLSPIAILATPILIIDNWIALNILLPAAIDTSPLNSFRILMGNLYGIAGISHFIDLLFGPSTLLVAAGLPQYQELSSIGQAYALLWCMSGPIAFYLSSLSLRRDNDTNTNNNESSKFSSSTSSTSAKVAADIGLVQYALIEILGAYFTGSESTLWNTIGVQGIVLAAWIYSQQKQQQIVKEEVIF